MSRSMSDRPSFDLMNTHKTHPFQPTRIIFAFAAIFNYFVWMKIINFFIVYNVKYKTIVSIYSFCYSSL